MEKSEEPPAAGVNAKDGALAPKPDGVDPNGVD